MIKLIICGVNGRLGKTLVNCTKKSNEYEIVAGVDKYDVTAKNGFPVFDDISKVTQIADAIIDFSRPDALKSILEYATLKKIGAVLATTGYSEEDKHMIVGYTKKIPVLFSANMSLGVNLQMELTKTAAEFLGDTYDIEIIEKHHNVKVDSPSGTALALAENLNNVFLQSKKFVYGRNPQSTRRSHSEIGIHSVRGGTVVGEHNVGFYGKDEIIEIVHKSLSTKVLAQGALRAVDFIIDKRPMLYSMADIISETNTVTRINAERNISIFKIIKIEHNPKFIAEIFTELANKDINLDIISQTLPFENSVNIAFSLPFSDVSLAKSIIKNLAFAKEIDFEIYEKSTKISIEGMGMEHQSGVAAKLFTALAEVDIKILIISTSETKISFCIENKDYPNAIKIVSKAFKL